MSDAGLMITAAIIARDAEKHLPGCLASVAWCERRLVVVDDRTTDKTEEIARSSGAEVIRRAFDDFAGQRNAALDACDTEWALFIDVDERVPAWLKEEITLVLAENGPEAGYWIPRINLICGRWVRHGGWHPDHQLRLLRRAAASYDPGRPVHEIVQIDGPTGYLTTPLLHLNYGSFEELIQKQRRYAPLDADRLTKDGDIRMRSLLGAPAREFLRRYFALGGVLDGPMGLLMALIMAGYEFQVRRLALGGQRD